MKKLTIEWNDFTKELKNSKKYSWLQRLSKEEKENLNWIVKEGHTLKNKQKNEILQIYKKQRLLNDMYGKDEGFKGIIKGIFKGRK
tara:strand:+ start:176 stop:433 length:258 start_codon:yes stop_codon:yes gene_type:complete